MFALVVRFKAKKGKEKNVEDLLSGVIEKVRRNEKDTLIYDMHRKIGDSTEILFYERYTDRDAWAVTHMSKPYIKELSGKLSEYLEGEIEISEYEVVEVK